MCVCVCVWCVCGVCMCILCVCLYVRGGRVGGWREYGPHLNLRESTVIYL